ncbi:MAG: glycoside hydrolase family 16 protein [Oscillospiraceae bacterium]|nr:glycoside hydrolase family 16 protein [Oscillospiraceae bacterium]
MVIFNTVVACFLSIVQALLSLMNLPLMAIGQKLDLDRFELVWSDEFGGESLDLEKWGGHGFTEGVHKRRDGYWCMDMAQVKDGMLHIPSVYSEDGVAGGPPGYYSLGIDTSRAFLQKFGYFEARCKLPKGQGLWSAFWMYNSSIGTVEGTPLDGTEIDIYESAYWREACGWKRDSISSNLHYYDGGYSGKLHSQNIGRYHVKEPYDTFHTYGLEWNENEYIFYIDGVETGRSSFGGVSQNAQYVILSVEHQLGGWAGDISLNTEMTDFVIDYVRVYQYKS